MFLHVRSEGSLGAIADKYWLQFISSCALLDLKDNFYRIKYQNDIRLNGTLSGQSNSLQFQSSFERIFKDMAFSLFWFDFLVIRVVIWCYFALLLHYSSV